MKELQFNNTNKGLIERRVKAESEARMAQHEAEMELLMALFAEEEVIEEEVTVEDVEFELMMVEDFRGFVLDINKDEVEWINNNVDLKHLIGTEDTVQALSKKLNLSITKVRKMVRSSLGYKRGSDYQNNQRQYVDELIEDFRHNLYEDLERQLKKAKLYDFYRALLDYIKSRVSLNPLGTDENELTFFVSYTDLRIVCREFGVSRGISDSQLLSKLSKLCGLGLLVNLQDEQIKDDVLETAKNIAKKQAKDIGVKIELNRRNFYILKDLSPEVQDEAIARVKLETESGLRSKDKSSTSLALVYGEEAQKAIMAQGEANISETKLRNFNEAAKILLEKQGYFTEEQLRVQYLKKDKNTKSRDSYELTRTYLAVTVISVNCIKTRVGAKIRKEHNLPKKIKSNSFVFIPR